MLKFDCPIAFDHRSDIPHLLLKNIENQNFQHDVRVFDTKLSYARRDKKLPGIIQRFKFKRHDIKKTCLVDSSKTLVLFPGGYEVLDFLFETICLVQTYKLKGKKIPNIILIDPRRDFYTKLLVTFLKPILVDAAEAANAKDLERFKIVATAEEMVSAQREFERQEK
jgi:predicted Rossmann-fold nucleotide-binding protein